MGVKIGWFNIREFFVEGRRTRGEGCSPLAPRPSPFNKKRRLVKGAALFYIKSNKSQNGPAQEPFD